VSQKRKETISFLPCQRSQRKYRQSLSITVCQCNWALSLKAHLHSIGNIICYLDSLSSSTANATIIVFTSTKVSYAEVAVTLRAYKWYYSSCMIMIIHWLYSKKSVWQGFSYLFSFKLFQVIYKSYRQVLTSSQISRLLLKPGFLDKFRLAYNSKQHIQDYTRYN